MTKHEVLELINQVSWYHSYEIFPGIITPGKCPVNTKWAFNQFGLSSRLTGKRILEIGTWDGPYAFELESRGADVVATDIHDPDNTGFNIGKKVLSSKVMYIRTSVYDLGKNLDGKFDIVLFMGVFYHLKYPILAFEQIHEVLKDDGLLLFEGECFSHYAETLNNRKVRSRLLLALLAHSNIPIALCYPASYKNASNWHIPNIACLKSWMRASRFRITKLQTIDGNKWIPQGGKNPMKFLIKIIRLLRHLTFHNSQRVLGTAIKINKKPIIEHGIVPKKNHTKV